MRLAYHRWSQHLQKSLISFIRTRILSQSLIQMAWTEVKFVTLSPQMLLQLEENPQTTKTWKQNLPRPGTAVPTVHKCVPFHFFWVERWLVSDCSHLAGHTWIFNGFVIQLYSQTSGNPCFDPDLKQHYLQNQSMLCAPPAWTCLQLQAASQGKDESCSDNSSQTPSTSGFCSRCVTACSTWSIMIPICCIRAIALWNPKKSYRCQDKKQLSNLSPLLLKRMSMFFSQKQKTSKPLCYSFVKGPCLKPEDSAKFEDVWQTHQV